MLNFLVETKKEYTIQLINLIYYKIYQGIESIYQNSVKVSKEEDILKVFQKLLKKVPRWDDNIKLQERVRILDDNAFLIENLMKATIKANIIILTYSPYKNKQTKINKELYNSVNVMDFIHKIYIECAREIFNNPFLFYHKYSPLEIKRNQRETFDLIKKSIEEAIRKMLPVQHILDIYLGDDTQSNIQIDKIITDADKNNLDVMVRKDLNLSKDQDDNKHFINKNNINIQEILDKNSIKISESNILDNLTSSSPLINNKSIKNDSIGSKIKDILEKDLKETDLEVSLSYKPEENSENYQEVFSNSSISKNTNKSFTAESMNTVDKEELKKKNKFFNNYLSF